MKTASTEREAIVAWLREMQHDAARLSWEDGISEVASAYHSGNCCAYLLAADAIQRGDHLKDQDHGRA